MIKSLFLALVSLFNLHLNRLDVHQPRTNFKLVYGRSVSISQSFRSHANNLNIVSICVRNPYRILEPLEFRLYPATTSAQPVRTLKLNAGNIDNQDCTRFQFDPLPQSQGKTYVASLVRLQPKRASSLYVEAYHDQDYLEGTAFRDQTPLHRDLHFKTFYRQPLTQTLNQAIYRFFSRLGQDIGFFIFYFFLLTTIIWRLVHLNSHD